MMHRSFQRKRLLAVLAAVAVIAVAARWILWSSPNGTEPSAGVVGTGDSRERGTGVEPATSGLVDADTARSMVSAATLVADVRVVGLPVDLAAACWVCLERSSDRMLHRLPLDADRGWRGVVASEEHVVSAVRSRDQAFRIVASGPVIVSPSQPVVVVEVKPWDSWRLFVRDGVTGGAVDPVFVRSGDDEERPWVPGPDGAFVLPAEAPGTLQRHRVSSPGYAGLEFSHHANQGDVHAVIWPCGGLSLLREQVCTLALEDSSGAMLYEDLAGSRKSVHLECVPVGTYRLHVGWEAGHRVEEVQVRRADTTRIRIDELADQMAYLVELNWTGQIDPEVLRGADVTIYGRVRDEAVDAVMPWSRIWREIATLPAAKWQERVSGLHHVQSTRLVRGSYLLVLNGLGVQEAFEIEPVAANQVAIESFDTVELHVDLSAWPAPHWPITLSWRYEGDALALNSVVVAQGPAATVRVCRRPLEMVAIGADHAMATPVSIEPGHPGQALRIALERGSALPLLVVEMYEDGRLAHLGGGVVPDVAPVGHDGRMTSHGLRESMPSCLLARVSRPGTYRIRGRVGETTVFDGLCEVGQGVTHFPVGVHRP